MKEKMKERIYMKKKQTVLFVAVIMIGVLVCGVGLLLGMKIGSEQYEGEVRYIDAPSSSVDLVTSDGNITKDSNLGTSSTAAVSNVAGKSNTEESNVAGKSNTTADINGEEQGNSADNRNTTGNNNEDVDSNPVEAGNTAVVGDEAPDNAAGKVDKVGGRTWLSGTHEGVYVVSSSLKKVTVNSEVDEIVIYSGSSKNIEIAQTYENLEEVELYTVVEGEKEFKIVTKSTNRNMGLPGMENVQRRSMLEIKLPVDFKGELDIANGVGSVHIFDKVILSKLTVTCGVGDIRILKTPDCSKVYLESGTGDISVVELWDVSESEFTVGVGNVKFVEDVTGKNFSVDVGIGDIIVTDKTKSKHKDSLTVGIGKIYTNFKE